MSVIRVLGPPPNVCLTLRAREPPAGAQALHVGFSTLAERSKIY